MEQGVLEYERVREKKKQLLIKIQETKVGIRHKQNQLQLLEEGLKRIQEQEGSESIGGNLNIFLRDFSVILEALKRYDILVCEEFSCLEFRTDRDTINWILKTEYRRSLHGKTTQKNHRERHRLCSRW